MENLENCQRFVRLVGLLAYLYIERVAGLDVPKMSVPSSAAIIGRLAGADKLSSI